MGPARRPPESGAASGAAGRREHMDPQSAPLVSTIRERCRLCYTCVRECPSKAIRIAGGQAEVLADRCIGCGNCVRVCSQAAKRVRCEVEPVEALLASGARVAALVAPSFPAEFTEIEYEYLVGMIRDLGFEYVCEVGFGADLVAAGRPLDYKAQIYQQYGAQVRVGPRKFDFDIFANINYGYVGRAAGFSEQELRGGAGAAQIVDNVLKPLLNGANPKWENIGPVTSYFDDPRDQAAIRIGIRLWDRYGLDVTPREFYRVFFPSANQLFR